jgi:hypothetical protein
MTPKQKAIKLIKSMTFSCRECDNAKISALILVSELIKENLRYDYIPFEGSRTEFYLQVEKELNKL